jgi:glucose/mannose transport system substrate-binding protein
MFAALLLVVGVAGPARAAAPAGAPATAPPAAAAPAGRAEVMHWWTSGGESAAVRTLADAWRAQGGTWQDSAIAGSEQARAVAISRIAGGNPPTAALFNTSRQFRDLIEAGELQPLDDVAARQGWANWLPAPLLDSIRIDGHFYAAPVSIHNPTWIWYSKAALKKAGVAAEPRSFDELFAALDRLKAAGLIPLAHGGQAWQESVLFRAVLANQGGRALYLRVLRDRDAGAIDSPAFRQVLLTFKRLHGYVDAGAPGRNWNDATALLVTGRAGFQVMGDWVKAEFAAAGKSSPRDYGCIAGFGPDAPYIVQGDAFVFPKARDAGVRAVQERLAATLTQPAVQLAFAARKGSIPVRNDVDAASLDPCGQAGYAIMKDGRRVVGNDENYLSPDQNGAVADVLTDYWNRDLGVEAVQRRFAAALAE